MVMQIYFTASIVGKKDYLKNYLKIIDVVKAKEHKIISDHIIEAPEKLATMTSIEERVAFRKQLDKWISSSDCVIAETSFPSISVGYEISIALHMDKPVLMLYTNGSPPHLISPSTDDKMFCEKYTDTTVRETIEDFLRYVGTSGGIRFTMFITSDLARYLDSVIKKNKIPKAVYIRRLIRDDMKKRLK